MLLVARPEAPFRPPSPWFLTFHPWALPGAHWVITSVSGQAENTHTSWWQGYGQKDERHSFSAKLAKNLKRAQRREDALCWHCSRHLAAAVKTDAHGQRRREARVERTKWKHTAHTLWGRAVSQPQCDNAMESALDQCHMGKYWQNKWSLQGRDGNILQWMWCDTVRFKSSL